MQYSEDKANWLLYFEDASVPSQLFASEYAARAAYEQRSIGYSCHLFARVERPCAICGRGPHTQDDPECIAGKREINRDAARYRWLRLAEPVIGAPSIHVRVWDGHHFQTNGEECDAFVDAAMSISSTSIVEEKKDMVDKPIEK